MPPLAVHSDSDSDVRSMIVFHDSICARGAGDRVLAGQRRRARERARAQRILVDGNQIDADDLALPQTEARNTDAPTTITDIERDAIERALAATAGNRRHAAARLGMPLRTFYDKLKRYGIS